MPGFPCAICGETCASSFLRLNGTYFHRHCFQCYICQCDLQNTGYYRKDNKLYCPKDFEKTFGSLCGICNCSISGDRVLAVGLQFHLKCFHCHLCRAVFQVKNRVLFIGNKFYCEECSKKITRTSNQKRKPQISKCSSPRRRTHSLPRPNQTDFGEFQEELSQRLAVQYRNCQSHTVGGQFRRELSLPPATLSPIAPLTNAETVTPQSPVRPRKPDEKKPPKVPKISCILEKPPQPPKEHPPSQAILRKEADPLRNSRVSHLVKIFEKIAENDGKLTETSLASSTEDCLQRLLESNPQGDSVDPPLLVDSSKVSIDDISASSDRSVKLNETLPVFLNNRETFYQQITHCRSRIRTRSTDTAEVPVGGSCLPVFQTSTDIPQQDPFALSVTVASKHEELTSGDAELSETPVDLLTRVVRWSKNLIGWKSIKDKSFLNLLGVTTLTVGLFASVVINLNVLLFNFKDWASDNLIFNYADKEDLVNCIRSLSLSFILRIFTP